VKHLDYWSKIENYLERSEGWVDIEQIIRDTNVPRWVVEQWFKKIALNSSLYEVKIVIFGGKQYRMVRLNGRRRV